jgi:hypothetical protein
MANPPNRSDVGDQNAVTAAIAGDAALQRLAMCDVPTSREIEQEYYIDIQ